MRVAAEHALQRSAIALDERALKGRVAGEAGGGLVGANELLLVGGQRGTQPCLQPRVDAPCLAPGRDGREAPERRRQREQGQQQEVGDELDFETTHGFSSSPPPPVPIDP
jgi:hypothetical protein